MDNLFNACNLLARQYSYTLTLYHQLLLGINIPIIGFSLLCLFSPVLKYSLTIGQG